MKCPKCQFGNPEGAKFCNQCGNRMQFICGKCGKQNALGSKFCSECGQDLGKPLEAPQVDYSSPQSYTPKFLATKILNTRSAMEGERKLVTVLFADVANFTSISEKLEPEEIHEIMDRCFNILMDEVHRYEGTINQFTGDGVMALFGAPLAHEDHAQRACQAALAIQRAMRDYGERLQKDYGIDFKMRIGLNSGSVIVGAIGDDLRMDYTAVGDTTNLASRMETLAVPGSILLSRGTHKLVRDYFEFQPVGLLPVKGKQEPQKAFKLIRAGEVTTRIGAAAVKGLTRFVGRKQSITSLVEAYEKVKDNGGQVVGIVGEAGVGKSRLLLEFRNRLLKAEFSYLEGRCVHYGGAMSYLPFLDILRSYFGIREGEREAIIKKRMAERLVKLEKKLKGILPPLQDLLSLKVENEGYLKLEPKVRRERVFEALRDLFLRESQERPLIMAVEDLHWIDKTSEEFLDYFIGWLANAKVLLVLLYRPEFTHRWGNKSYFNRIGLDELTLQSSAELVKAILEEGEAAPELRDLILNRAAGNPLFMEELTHALLENGTIEKKDKQYILTRTSSDLQVPDTIQGIIAARLDRLEENLKRIMQVASVIGREFAFRILQAISDMHEELKSSLLNLQGLEFIYEKSLFPELEYIFKHALTQEVAYNSLLLKRRKEIHEKIGRAIEELYPERHEEFYEVFAHHYSRSDNLEKALQYLRLSAEKAARNNSLQEAIGFHKESLVTLGRMPETDLAKKEKLRVILSMAPILRQLSYPEDASGILQEGEKLSKDLEDKRGLAAIYSHLALYYSFKGENAPASSYLELSLSEEGNASEIDALGPYYFSLLVSSYFEGNFLKIMDFAPSIIRMLEESHRESEDFGMPAILYVGLHGLYGASLGLIGDFERGEELCKKGVAFACEVGHLFSIGVAEMCYGSLLGVSERGEEAEGHLYKSIESYERAQGKIWVPVIWALIGLVRLRMEDFPKAKECFERSLEMQAASGLQTYLSFEHFCLSLLHDNAGDFRKAFLHAEKAVDLARKNKERPFEGMSLVQMGWTEWKSQSCDLIGAEQTMIEGIRILMELEAKPYAAQGYLALGKLYSAGGQREKALQNLKKAEKMLREMGMNYSLAQARELIMNLSLKR
jgi:class 3 adenylate cyclase